MQGGTTYTFVRDRPHSSWPVLPPATGTSASGRANIIRQYLKAGLLDEMHLHLIPMLLGNGIRLFEGLDPDGIGLKRTSSIETPGATHLRFDVVKAVA